MAGACVRSGISGWVIGLLIGWRAVAERRAANEGKQVAKGTPAARIKEVRLGGGKRIRPNSHIVVKSKVMRRSERSRESEAPADRASGEIGQRPGSARCVETNRTANSDH